MSVFAFDGKWRALGLGLVMIRPSFVIDNRGVVPLVRALRSTNTSIHSTGYKYTITY